MSVSTDPSSTNTQLRRPAHLTESPVEGLTLTAINRHFKPRVVDAEDARPLPRPVQRPRPGRHRAPEVPLPGERSTGPISRVPVGPELPPRLVGEGPTQRIPAVQRAVEVPLPTRERGAALAAAQSRSRVAWLQTALMRTQQKLRAAGFIRGGEQ